MRGQALMIVDSLTFPWGVVATGILVHPATMVVTAMQMQPRIHGQAVIKSLNVTRPFRVCSVFKPHRVTPYYQR